MELTINKKYGNEKDPTLSEYGTIYNTNETIQMNNFCDLLENIENKGNRFFYCLASRYNDNGVLGFSKFNSIDSLRKFDSDPDSSLNAIFLKANSDEYSLSVSSSVNSKSIDIGYDKDTADVVASDLEEEKMFAEAKKKQEEEKKMNEEGYTK